MRKQEKNDEKRNSVNRTVSVILGLSLCCGALIYGAKKVETAYPTAVFVKNQNPVIVIDAGHGGIDGGCTDADGVPEKGINLNILLALRDMLTASGYTVEVTRDTDTSIHDKGIEGISSQKSSDMDNRLALFNKYDNAVCISIHQNQFTDSKYNGAQMFYSLTNPKSEKLAGILQSNFKKFIQPDNDREIKQCGQELFLCYFSENPTVMVECGFLSNEEEAEKLKTEEYQHQVAFTIYASLIEYLSQK
jgi:N-acetylmuramoyl-L-alanine amidase